MTPPTPTSTESPTLATLINRLRDDLKLWWDRLSYHPEKRYMRGRRDA